MTKEFGRQMKKKAFQLFIESSSLTKVAFMEQYNVQPYIKDPQHYNFFVHTVVQRI
jgi:hypothetical protein